MAIIYDGCDEHDNDDEPDYTGDDIILIVCLGLGLVGIVVGLMEMVEAAIK